MSPTQREKRGNKPSQDQKEKTNIKKGRTSVKKYFNPTKRDHRKTRKRKKNTHILLKKKKGERRLGGEGRAVRDRVHRWGKGGFWCCLRDQVLMRREKYY